MAEQAWGKVCCAGAGARQLSMVSLCLQSWMQDCLATADMGAGTAHLKHPRLSVQDCMLTPGQLVHWLVLIFEWIEDLYTRLDLTQSGAIDATVDAPAIFKVLADNGLHRLWPPLRQAFDDASVLTADKFVAVCFHWLGITEAFECQVLQGAHPDAT